MTAAAPNLAGAPANGWACGPASAIGEQQLDNRGFPQAGVAAAAAAPFPPRPGSALSVHSSSGASDPPLSVPALKALRQSLSRQASAGLAPGGAAGEHPSHSQPGSPSSSLGTPKVALARSKLGLPNGVLEAGQPAAGVAAALQGAQLCCWVVLGCTGKGVMLAADAPLLLQKPDQ